jgi:hypothetical protein
MHKSAILASLLMTAVVLPAGARAQSAAAAMQAFYPSWSPETKTLGPGSRRTGAVMGAQKVTSNLHVVLIELDPDPGSRAGLPTCEVGVVSRSEDGTLTAVGKLETQRCMGVDTSPADTVDSRPLFAIRHTNDGQRHNLAIYTVTPSSSVAEVFGEEVQSADQECELASSGARTLMLTCVGKKAPDFSARLFEWNGTRFAETTSRYSAGPGKPKLRGIVPGRSLGRVSLGMKKEAVRKLVGKPSESYDIRPNVSTDLWSNASAKPGTPSAATEIVYVGDAVAQISVWPPFYKLGPLDTSKLTLSGLEAMAASKLLTKNVYGGQHDLVVIYFDDAERGVAYRCEGIGSEMEVGKDGQPTGGLIDKRDKLSCGSILVHRPNAAVIPGATEFKIP